MYGSCISRSDYCQRARTCEAESKAVTGAHKSVKNISNYHEDEVPSKQWEQTTS